MTSFQEPNPDDASRPDTTRPEVRSNEESFFEQDSGTPVRRIPHLGHALAFASFTGVLLILLEFILSAMGWAPGTVKNGVTILTHPKLQIATLVVTYLTTLGAASLIFPQLWQRGFLDGIEWRWSAAREQAGRLIALGLALGMLVQLLARFIMPPKSLPVDDFLRTQSDAWLITLFGTVVAPIFEEICFRGFLLPAFAIAYDWISLPRTEEARERWRSTTTLTPAAWIFSALLTSVFFALMHLQQVAHLWAVLLVLFSVSLVLTTVRVKTRSVAASVLVHGAYNGFVFLVMMIATGGYRHLERMAQ